MGFYDEAIRKSTKEDNQYAVKNINKMIQGYKDTGIMSSAGEISDGYHTFDELYHHRALLFASLCNISPKGIVWKSKKHDDGTMFDGMFIVGIHTAYGDATYHYNIDPYWDMFHVPEIERAPVFDGHSPEEALNRIYKHFSK